uniref:Response regulatory domain-containing protein n=1 Tax=Tetraselmis chuii TaxID=63592 RepID=A0A7S1SM18_9CHLO|mmetsp:Transcript_1855/g.3255  ORF Transcript_1855/g.3255 Transcript_1855/m.3255 type:complete len:438 (+) Transcript_1855:173-1486(+)|eukprot:CAMPEP_0177764788 /NCGR_PEP_ID=MMETSP0491_2-20121128/7608_1 /TAXON_ID=63592 /ORGANISM="Tetraselmis chuii, Strain PLY429" /LENGTH=437 /DNA_ID=CAMNT_0019281019 /DNA_START=818 /DNA_END=2131 /DNA_ORIENTATION=+
MTTVLASKHFSERPSFPADLEVLLVDSSKQASETARKALQGCSYRVTVCSSCGEAASTLSRKAIDLVLVEQKLFMGQLAGAAQLKAAATLVPTVVISDSGSAKDVWAAIAGRAVDVLTRPLSKQKLQTLWQHTVRMQRSPLPTPATSCGDISKTAPFVNSESTVTAAMKETATPVLSDSKKRKLKEVSGPLVTARPPLSISPNGIVSAVPLPRHMHPPGAVMGYWPQPIMAPMMACPQAAHAWGTPVMGIPAGQQGAAHFIGHPHMTVQMPHGLMASVPGQPVGSQPMLIHAMPQARPLAALPALPAPQQKVEAPPVSKIGAEEAPQEPSIKEPLSPTQSCGSFHAMSDNSCGSQLALVSSDHFINSDSSNDTTQDSQPSCDPTSLDDISEDDYAFIDFALSDSFPIVDQDEILPPLGLSLKKSSSLLNMLNVQMVY